MKILQAKFRQTIVGMGSKLQVDKVSYADLRLVKSPEGVAFTNSIGSKLFVPMNNVSEIVFEDEVKDLEEVTELDIEAKVRKKMMGK